ncbi:NUDIX domain-containing protein [Pseudomonas sp. XS1P51]
MRVDKACPVVLRNIEQLEILAFRHPLAGLQLVKGSVEPGELTGAAAVRELFAFFWHPLASEPSEEWHQIFKDALAFLRQRMR